MAGISDAGQSGFPLQGFDSCGAAGAGLSFVFGSGEARGAQRNSGVAEFLFQVADVRAGTLSGARFIYSINEIEKYVAVDEGRRADHASGRRILRLISSIRGWKRESHMARQRETIHWRYWPSGSVLDAVSRLRYCASYPPVQL